MAMMRPRVHATTKVQLSEVEEDNCVVAYFEMKEFVNIIVWFSAI